jgi:hypothetical protein
LIRQPGPDAELEAARYADRMIDRGDAVGAGKFRVHRRRIDP